MTLKNLLATFPFIAITRGLTPDSAVEIAQTLYDEGFRIIENPLNSPEPLESIRRISSEIGDSALIGAGTVTRPEQVQAVKEAGGKLIISPHCDPLIIQETKKQGLLSIPGVTTPTEAMTAIQNGADGLKLFPAEIVQPHVLKAIRAILPENTLLLPVGSITAANWQPFVEVGAAGFGLGSSLYKKDITLNRLRENAQAFRNSWTEYKAVHR